MHQTGIENVVSSSGTARQDTHDINRFTKQYHHTIWQWLSSASKHHSEVSLILFSVSWMNVKAGSSPNGEDPGFAPHKNTMHDDEFLNTFGAIETDLSISKSAFCLIEIVKTLPGVPTDKRYCTQHISHLEAITCPFTSASVAVCYALTKIYYTPR